MMSQTKTIKPSRPSASLILNLENQGQSAHRYLTLIRKPHMSFANSVVFPGGVCEPIDDKYLQSKTFTVYSKITALRETTEQTGILLLPPNIQFSRLQQFKQLYKSKRFEQIQDFVSKIWSLEPNLALVKPIFRVITPHLPKVSRYDCIFYILNKNIQKINLGSSLNVQTLDIAVNQSSSYFWKQPNEYLASFLQGNLDIPPPQRIIFTALANIKTMGLSVQHLLEDQQLTIEPFLFQFASQSRLSVARDLDYNIQKIIDGEPQSPTSKEVSKYLQSHLDRNEARIRRKIHLLRSQERLKVYFEYSGTTPEPTLFKYLPTVQSSL